MFSGIEQIKWSCRLQWLKSLCAYIGVHEHAACNAKCHAASLPGRDDAGRHVLCKSSSAVRVAIPERICPDGCRPQKLTPLTCCPCPIFLNPQASRHRKRMVAHFPRPVAPRRSGTSRSCSSWKKNPSQAQISMGVSQLGSLLKKMQLAASAISVRDSAGSERCHFMCSPCQASIAVCVSTC